MKTATAICALSVAAAIAFGGTALAQSSTDQQQNTSTNTQLNQDPAKDDTGMLALGVDISKVGGSPDAAKAFVATLPADQQTSLNNACKDIQSKQATSNPNVVIFCNNLLGTAQ